MGLRTLGLSALALQRAPQVLHQSGSDSGTPAVMSQMSVAVRGHTGAVQSSVLTWRMDTLCVVCVRV